MNTVFYLVTGSLWVALAAPVCILWSLDPLADSLLEKVVTRITQIALTVAWLSTGVSILYA